MIRFYNFFEVTIECIEIIVLESISIRRIRDYSRRRITRKEWRKFLCILARKVDIARYSCSLCISLGDFYHQRIDIGSVYLILSAWIGFHAGDIFHARKLISHMKGEWLNTEMSIHSWGDIAGEHRCFYGDRPWSTKWIKEWFPIFPVRESNKCACEIFFYGSLSRFLSIPSLMERITSDIQKDMSDIIYYEDKNMDFYRIGIVGSMECRKDRLLAYRLDRRNARESRSSRRCLDDDELFSSEIFTPANICKSIMKGIKTGDFLSMNIYVYSIRESTSYKKFISMSKFSWSRYEPILNFHISKSYLLRFSAHEGLKSWLTGESESYIARIVADFLVLLGGVWDDFHECEYREKRENVKVCFTQNDYKDKKSINYCFSPLSE